MLRSWFLKEPINLRSLDCNLPSYYTLLPGLMLNEMSSFEEAHKHHPSVFLSSEQGHSQGNWIRKRLAGGNAWTCAITAFANEENPLLYAKSLRVANQTDSFVATGIKQSEACVTRPGLRMFRSRAQQGFQIRGSQRWLWGPGTPSEKVNREETGESTTGLTLLSWRLSTIPRHPKKAVWSENKLSWASRTLQRPKLLHHIQGD